MVYHLALPPQLAGVHNVFYVSMLQKYEPHPSQIINWEKINLDEDVTFEKNPVKILDRREKKLRGKTIPLVRVLWRQRGMEELTWEREDMIRANYPLLFESKDSSTIRDTIIPHVALWFTREAIQGNDFEDVDNDNDDEDNNDEEENEDIDEDNDEDTDEDEDKDKTSTKKKSMRALRKEGQQSECPPKYKQQ
ncbi:nucleosome assembly protein 1;3-like [Camellia sinensis]|uniref:nucleosome assembly protein 1;3-like n=1 Tax=Camellia sinensis TaxID=4442 RepID=UPI0010368F15|nr:nucleosome assembly protein 1;3-like [Camellia sinensis]